MGNRGVENQAINQAGGDEAVSAEINDEALAMVLDVLRKAKCPNGCDQGVIATGEQGEYGEIAKMCDWCVSRMEILRDR